MMTNVEELRRLQILNDYITQSIDAAHRIAPLLQARGLWHTPFGAQPIGASPWVRSPFVGQVPFAGQVPFTGGVPSTIGAGLYHTTAPGFVDPLMASYGAGLQGLVPQAVDPVAAIVQSTYAQPFVAELVRRALCGY